LNLPQVAINTFVWAGELGVISLGLSLSYAILGFFNFAQPEFVTIGGYLAWAAYRLMGLPILIAAGLSLAGTGLIAVGIDLLVFRPLRTVSPASKMIASVGVAIAIRMILQITFGGAAKTFGLIWRPLHVVRGAYLTSLEVWIVGLTAFAMVLFYLVLAKTKIGLALRATADNFALAQARGVNGARIISWMWFLSGALGALGGIVLGMETQLRPSSGLFILVPVFSAATVGGFGNAFGAVAGAGLLALAQNIVLAVNFGALAGSSRGWYIPTDYKDVIALAALIVTLLIRPLGLFAARRRND
jgi:branched-subunit amino acid ABC-type transport system permease component